MTRDEFNGLVEIRITATRLTLARKRDEYAPGDDVLHNFREAAKTRGQSLGEALLGMLVKHWISIQDMTRAIDRKDCWPAPKMIDEKIVDAVNYLILLEAILKENSRQT